MYLGIRCVIAKSFARIHAANLINAGILPLTFADAEDYEELHQDDVLKLSDVFEGMNTGEVTLENVTTGQKLKLQCDLSDRQRKILLAGGLLPYTKEGGQ